MKFIRNVILIFSLGLMIFSLEGCSKYQKMKFEEAQRRREFEREKEQREKEAQKAYEQAIKHHYAIQDENTRKQMKENARKSKNFKENKKPGFLKKLFTPKQKKGKSKRIEK